jgi:pseudoazurin
VSAAREWIWSFEMRSTGRVTLAAAMILMGITTAKAAEYEMKTLNMTPHGMFQLDPALLRIQPGDTVHFVAKDKGHNVQSVVGMIPDGAEPFKGQTNKDLTVTLTKPGVYGVECAPHYGMGMVGLIVVGDPSSNLEKAEAVPQPGKAKQAFAKLFEDVTSHN